MINRPRSGQPGATPGEGLQPAVAPPLAPGFNLQIKSTIKNQFPRQRAGRTPPPRETRNPRKLGAVSWASDPNEKLTGRLDTPYIGPKSEALGSPSSRLLLNTPYFVCVSTICSIIRINRISTEN